MRGYLWLLGAVLFLAVAVLVVRPPGVHIDRVDVRVTDDTDGL